MALGTKFRIEGTSDIFGKVTVNIKLDGYTGAVIPLDGVGRNWVELKIGDNSNDISNPILPGKLTVQFYVMADFATTELGRSESFTYYVEALDGNDDLIWAGWAIPDEYREAYHNTPYIATLVASDGLEELKTELYEIESGKDTLLVHLINALDKTLLSLPIFESINIYSNGMSAGQDNSPLDQCSVVYDSFLKIKETPNCYDVISSLLTPFFARIYQYRGWRVENILEKRGSYYVREFNSSGVFQDDQLFDPLVTLDTTYDDYKAFIQKSGNLVFNPALKNAEVYFNTVEPTSQTVSGGFQKEADWVSTSELVNWSTVGSLTVEKVEVNANGNKFAVRIPGRVTTFDNTTNYIKSNSFTIDSANFQTIKVKFDYWADWPNVVIFGSSPVLFFAAVFTEASTGITYSWYNTWYSGTQIKANYITPNKRQVWRTYSIDIDRVPGDGVLEFRFYKLYKSGSEGSTALRLTGWNVNLLVEQPQNDRLLLEGGTTTVKTTVRGPSFQHYISDGLILDSAGVIDANGTLTNSWNRRGKTDNLNIRRLFILQWLSFNSITQEVLTGNTFQRGEAITPMSVIKDKDLVSSVRYVMQSFRVSLGSGFGTSNYRQININDATVTFFQEFLNEPRGIDYFPARPTVPGAPTIAPPDQFSGGEFPTGLNGDVRNAFDQTEITPGSILNKDLLDITGLSADDIVFNAVKNDFSQDNVTNLRLIDVAEVLADDSLVPYDGATKDVDLGVQGITTEWVKLNITPAIPTDQGSLYWDEDDNVLAVVLNGAIQKVGEVTFYNVKNQTGSTIPKGTGVGFAGVVGASGRIKVAPFLANGSQPSIYYVGITAEEILNGEDGKVYNFGPIRGLNTSAFSEGDVLYASSTVAGGFTTTPPTAPNNVIVVAAVLADSATVGALLVRVTVADLGGAGRDDDAVHYDASDSKNATERNQARVNIGSTSATPQVIATAGAIDDLTITSNSLVFTGASVVLSGIVAGLDGEEITILNTNAASLSILNQSTLSTANNRIIGAVLVPQFSIVRLKYRTTTNRWTLENVGINDARYYRKDQVETSSFPVQWTLGSGGSITIRQNQGNPTAITIDKINATSSTDIIRVRRNVDISPTECFVIDSQGQATFEKGPVSLTRSIVSQGLGSTQLIRRDELPYEVSQTIATAGTINNLAINSDTCILVLTGADDLTGVVPALITGRARKLLIEARGASRIIRDQSASSTDANRFSLGADLTINDGEVYQFIYTNSRWRRVL
jgi:hypothetical protein